MHISEKLRLRALDLLHIAYASLLKEKVEAFISDDEELLEARRKIREVSEVEVRSIQQLR